MEKPMQTVAGLMAVAARTAPKARGEDFVEIKIISGSAISKLGDDMINYGEQNDLPNFDRDGENVKSSDAVILLALKDATPLGLNCGACGFKTCSSMQKAVTKGPEFTGPICTWRIADLGIALGSAVKTASLLNADNRIMYRIGVIAINNNLIEGQVALGIPLSATGKNIYFDR